MRASACRLGRARCRAGVVDSRRRRRSPHDGARETLVRDRRCAGARLRGCRLADRRSSAVGEDSAGRVVRRTARFDRRTSSDARDLRQRGPRRAGRRAGRHACCAYERRAATRSRASASSSSGRCDASMSGVLFTRRAGPTPARCCSSTAAASARRSSPAAINPGRVSIAPARDALVRAGGCPRRRRRSGRDAFLQRRPLARSTRLALDDRARVRRAAGHRVDDRRRRARSGSSRRGRSPHASTARRRPGCDSRSGRTPTSTRTFREPISPLLYSVARPATTTTSAISAARSASRAAGSRAMDAPLAPDHRRPRRADVLQPDEHPHGAARGAVRRALAGVVQPVRRRRETAPRQRRAAPDGARGRARRRRSSSRVIAAKTDVAVPVPHPPRRTVRSARPTRSPRATHPDRARRAVARRRCSTDLRGFIDIRCHRWNDASLADAGVDGLLRRAARRCSRRAFPGRRPAGAPQHAAEGAAGSGEQHAGARAVEAVAADSRRRGAARRSSPTAGRRACSPRIRARPPVRARSARASTRYLDDWGFRCSAELMLTVPSFQEDPRRAHRSPEGLRRDGRRVAGDAPARASRRERARETRARARGAAPASVSAPAIRHQSVVVGTAPALDAALDPAARARAAQAGAALQPAAPHRARASATGSSATAGSTGRDDVFILTVDELDALASRRRDVPGSRRRAGRPAAATRTRRSPRMRPPDTIRARRGGDVPGDRRIAPARDRAARRRAPGGAARALHGIGACGGSTTARATVLADVTEAHRLSRRRRARHAPDRSRLGARLSAHLRPRDGARRHAVARRDHRPRVRHSLRRRRHATRRGSSRTARTVTVDGDRGIVHMRRWRGAA